MAPTPRISRDLLIRGVAYRIQEEVHRGLGKSHRRQLQRLAETLRDGGAIGKEKRLIVAALVPKANRDPVLIKAVVRAHQWFEMLKCRAVESITEIAKAEGLPRTYVGSIIPFPLLAPDITEAILEGTQPIDLSLDRLINATLPIDWAEQRAVLGHFCYSPWPHFSSWLKLSF